jgi:hypothetical protein
LEHTDGGCSETTDTKGTSAKLNTSSDTTIEEKREVRVRMNPTSGARDNPEFLPD